MKVFKALPIIFHVLIICPVLAEVKWDNSIKSDKVDSQKSKFNAELDLNENDSDLKNKINWEKVIDYKYPIKKNIKWKLDEKIDLYQINDYPKSIEEKLNKLISQEYTNKFNLGIGQSVPTANIISQGDFEYSFMQTAPIETSYGSGGTGNQNYLFSTNYGFNENLTIGVFYTHSDDPLHSKVNNHPTQTSNKWISYGTSFRWQVIKHKNKKIALTGSLENWKVKSGGCNLFNCSYTSKNIFNSSLNSVENDNLVGSISIPVTWSLSDKFQVSVTPRAIFLPSKQGNREGSGEFYGNNIGFGAGIEYKPLMRLKVFSSTFIPIGPGYNNFNKDLKFTRNKIFTAGLNYALDNEISFEASLTNSFGLSPSTSILTIPSDNEILYGMKMIYRPSSVYWSKVNTPNEKKHSLDGLSVSNAQIINKGTTKAKVNYNQKGSWSYKQDWGISELFNIDLAISKISQKLRLPNQLQGKYHDPERIYIRGGGKAKILSQDKGDFITSSLRVSAGRLKGTGWVFGEILNTYKISKILSFNLNPKSSFSGTGNPLGIGTSLNWKIRPNISIIPEANFALKESQNNWTLAIRFSPSEDKYIDLYTTNSLSFVDTGQLMRAEEQSFGINLGTIF